MMRREVFKAAPLLAIPAFLATDSVAGIIEEQTPCAQLFAIWEMERNRINGFEGEAMAEAEFDIAVERFGMLDDKMRLTPAETARDVILKFIVVSDRGACGLPVREACPELWVEADRFAGLE